MYLPVIFITSVPCYMLYAESASPCLLLHKVKTLNHTNLIVHDLSVFCLHSQFEYWLIVSRVAAH